MWNLLVSLSFLIELSAPQPLEEKNAELAWRPNYLILQMEMELEQGKGWSKEVAASQKVGWELTPLL